jgi:hypothetical protein
MYLFWLLCVLLNMEIGRFGEFDIVVVCGGFPLYPCSDIEIYHIGRTDALGDASV